MFKNFNEMFKLNLTLVLLLTELKKKTLIFRDFSKNRNKTDQKSHNKS